MDGYIFLPFPLLRVSIYQASDYNNKAGAKRSFSLLNASFELHCVGEKRFEIFQLKKGDFMFLSSNRD